MKTWQKVGIGSGVVVVLGSLVLFSVYQVNKGVETVQSGQVARQDLTSVVTASGEIRPRTTRTCWAKVSVRLRTLS